MDGFDWPEPLLIDAMGELYGHAADGRIAARTHARFLRELVDGDARRSAAFRLELIGCCAARGIGTGTIEAADRSAFRELTRIVQTRFRNSPRLRLQHIRRLREALDRLPGGRTPAPAATAGAAREALRLV